MQQNDLKIKRALISVSDKSGIVEFAQKLKAWDIEIISTGGTAKLLQSHDIEITPIQKVTGNPEAFGGRMKSISFQVGSALLFRRFHDQDIKDAKEQNIDSIDLVVCNLYPFEKVAQKTDASEDELIENIDIGGPTMIRAAAKNYESVSVLTDPEQYLLFTQTYEKDQTLDFSFRRKLALKAFNKTAQYDLAIANKLNTEFDEQQLAGISLKEPKALRYGENPHQKAHYYKFNNIEGHSIANANILQGKQLSYNNLLDADAAWKICSDAFHSSEFIEDPYAVAVIKHLNPCGLAVGPDAQKALELAWAADPVSAFGGIICFSHEVDEKAAQWFSDKFIEIIIAPKFSEKAKDLLAKKKNLRLLEVPLNTQYSKEMVVRSISGALIIQDEDTGLDKEFQQVTKNKFQQEQINLSYFGTMACKHLKSNAICLVNKTEDGSVWLTGAGMGQPNRLDALRYLTVPRFELKDNLNIKESILISDAFFPFKDSIEVANEFNIKYIVQPGGSIRDEEVINACNEFDIAMVFTGRRHFRH